MILVLRIAGQTATRSQVPVFDGLAEGFTKLASDPVLWVHYTGRSGERIGHEQAGFLETTQT